MRFCGAMTVVPGRDAHLWSPRTTMGKIVERAPTAELFARPQHPYTMALLSAVPEVGGARREPAPIEGEPPSAVHIPPGCRFHPRCPWKVERCLTQSPQLDELLPGHFAACHVAEDRLAAGDPALVAAQGV